MGERGASRLGELRGVASVFAGLLLAAGLSGCAVRLRPPEVFRPSTDPGQAWSRVLSRVVDAAGRVDIEALRADPEDLHEFVSYVATHSPETDPGLFETADSRLAFYLNAYNALAMYNALSAERLEAIGGSFLRVKLMVGGSLTSLRALESGPIRSLGDPRAYFAISCMARSSPRLARVPFLPAEVQRQLEEGARSFLSDFRNVQVDDASRTARFSRVLKLHQEEFLAGGAPSLTAYVNRYRELRIPEKYRVRFLPFDRRPNLRPPKGSASDGLPGSKPSPAPSAAPGAQGM